MKRNGFTIVEMLMVIGILGVLVTIITGASASAIRQARTRRTEAMRVVLQAGISAYYTKEGEWPGALKNLCDNGPQKAESKKTHVYYLTDNEADGVFQRVVEDSRSGTPLLDVSALFVCRNAAASSKNSSGTDFRSAISKVSGNAAGGNSKLSVSQMAFGYPRHKDGHFRRYVIKYNFDTDSVNVLTQNEGDDSGHDYHVENENQENWPKYWNNQQD